MNQERSIVHLDLDTFFVSVERLLNSSLNNKPVLVGGVSDRGVVASCSYEARQYGIHSGMSMKIARRLCPEAAVVKGDSSIVNLDDLIAKSKASAGKLSIGNEGPRTFSGMIARLFNARAGTGANLVAYANVGQGTTDLMGGHVDAMVADLASTAPLVRQGKLRVLATTAAKRVQGWENVPALSEKLPGFDMVGWFAVVAPTGTPAAAIERSNRDINALLSDKEVAERIANIGPLVDASMNVDAVGAFLKSESARWQSIAKEIGVLPE